MSISENLQLVLNEIHRISEQYHRNPPKLIAVSKNHSVNSILEAYQAGQRDFGENRVQELIAKQPLLPKDIRWHLIGHLQTNKVKYLISFVGLIHSVDSEKLVAEIQRHAQKHNKIVNILLQINISNEAQKHGLHENDAKILLKNLKNYPNVKVLGLMGIAEDTEEKKNISNQFSYLSQLQKQFQQFENEQIEMKELSMGMSSDYEVAIQNHSTYVRIGTAIFGSRGY